MERILKIVIDLLKGATYDLEAKFTQADSQSHYLQIDFKDTTLNFSGVSMKVNFIRSDGVAVTTSKASVTSSNKVQIPTNALAKFGELGIEIILIKGSTILTINKLIRVNVVQTLAGEGKDLEIGDSFINEINQLTVNFAKVLSTEGDKQIERVRSAGDEVVKHIESVIGNNAEGGNAVAVGGLSRAGIETLVDNVVGKVEDGKFPLTSAEVGKVYEAVNGKKYKCITAYSGSSLSTPNANFVEMSLNNHADRLDNLSEVNITNIETKLEQGTFARNIKFNNHYNRRFVSLYFSVDTKVEKYYLTADLKSGMTAHQLILTSSDEVRFEVYSNSINLYHVSSANVTLHKILCYD